MIKSLYLHTVYTTCQNDSDQSKNRVEAKQDEGR